MRRVSIFVALSTVLLTASCTSKKQEKEEVKEYPTTSALKVDTILTKEYVSQIQSIRNIEIRTQERGFLQHIYVDEGQFVHKGQLMFKIMPNLYQAEYAKSKAEMNEAAIELQNARLLTENNIVSKNEQAVAQAHLDKAKAEAELARLHLSFTEIRAPFDGIIDRIPLKLGSLIEEGELLTNLSDNSQMYAYFNVSEPEYLDYQLHKDGKGNQEVSLVLANNQLMPAKGVIKTIEGEFNNETGNIAFRATFPNPNRILRNGETGKVQMVKPLYDVLIIPQKATYEIQDKKYVFVVDKNGVLKSRNISVGTEMTDLYVVTSGLTVKDKILLEGIQKVKDNEQVKTHFVQPKKVISALKLKAS